MPDDMLNATHDPQLKSWVTSANDPATDFPIQNLPYGRFRRAGTNEAWRIGVAIGDQVLDLQRAHAQGNDWLAPLAGDDLNAFMAMGREAWARVREGLSDALREGGQRQLANCLVPQREAEMTLPCRIGDYTDFYAGIHHATAVGKLFRPDNPLLPNYQWVPIGYHGRSSSIGVSGQRFHRPSGQIKAPDAAQPSFGPCQRLDYELEVGVLVGPGNAQGTSIAMVDAEAHLFGMVLLNDWSARDIQAWEYQPLGPFLSKSFATTISPWVVTMEALAPFRAPFKRPADHPQPLPYLDSSFNREHGAIDIQLQVWLKTTGMSAPQQLTSSNYRDAYWTAAQMLAHHASNGCNLSAGDLLGSGTQSGPGEGEGGSLLELTRGGKQPITLANGEKRTFLQDGDTLVLRAHCERAGARRIGFGDCSGTVLPAV